MSLILRLRCLFLAVLVASALPAAAQDRDPEGLWALRADGQVLFLLELRRDAQSPGGWAGRWSGLTSSPSTTRIGLPTLAARSFAARSATRCPAAIRSS